MSKINGTLMEFQKSKKNMQLGCNRQKIVNTELKKTHLEMPICYVLIDHCVPSNNYC